MLQHLLLVEPDDKVAATLTARARVLSEVHRHARFESARAELLAVPFDFIATNVRLHDFNGLHLVHLVAAAKLAARTIVYTDFYEPHLAHEVQQAGAFYETRDCLERALVAYLRGALPPHDRRDPDVRNRRAGPLGGRRCWDRTPDVTVTTRQSTLEVKLRAIGADKRPRPALRFDERTVRAILDEGRHRP